MSAGTAPAYVLPNLLEIAFEKATRHLKDFLKLSWKVFEPGVDFVENWHIDLCCEWGEVFVAGEVTDLVVNMPPRQSKSSIYGVSLQPWAWIHVPQSRWMFSSYAEKFALRDNVRARRLIQSRWYQLGWGHVFGMMPDQNEKGRFENTETGYRLAIGVGGSATGEGYDFGVADDPQNMKEIHSKAYRDGSIQWNDFVWSTRKNHSRAGRLWIQQRGHENDLSGHVVKRYQNQDGFEHVVIDMRCEKPTRVFFPRSCREYEREDGELLNPERLNEKAVQALERDLGPYGAAAQLQQRPHPAGGGIFKRDWWSFYDPRSGMPEKLDVFIMSWDTAFKKGKENDWSCGTLWGSVDRDRYLVDRLRERLTFPELRRRAKGWFLRWNEALLKRFKRKIMWVLVEDAASGQSLVQEWKEDPELRRYVKPIRVDSDKVSRAHAATPPIAAGEVYLPEGAAWLDEYLDEFEHFPGSEYKDQVDSTTQALIFLKDRARTGKVRVATVG